MSKIRFFNARIAQFTGTPSILEGELHTENDRISFVGTNTNPNGKNFDREIDCQGNLLLPGFKNAHAHTAMTFLRSHADDLPLHEWLNRQVFPYEMLLTPEDIYTLVQHGICEYLTSGITSALDMYFHRDATAQACIDAGYRLVFSGVGGKPDFIEKEYKTYNNLDPLLSFKIGTHAEYTTDLNNLKEIAEVCQQYKEPFLTHILETARELRKCKEKYGIGPLKLFDSIGLLDYGGTGYHLVHTDDEDLDILKNHNMFAVTCPSSNLKLSSGIARVTEMQEKGIPVAIGTDGAASNNALDFFREMALVSMLQKYKHKAATCDALDVLKMACCTGSHAMYLNDLDDLTVGKIADIVMIDLTQPNMHPLNNILKNVIYAGSKQNVKMTMIAGRILYENGEFKNGLDVDKLNAQADAIIQRMDKQIANN